MPENITQPTKKTNSLITTFKVFAEILLVIGFILFEKVIWEQLVYPVKEAVSKLKLFVKFEAWLTTQNTITTLGFFLAPFIAAELLSIYSGGLIITGHILIGITLYIAKIPVAGIAFWIFSFSKEKLLSLDWFNTIYKLIIKGFDWVKSTKIYDRVQKKIEAIKKYLKELKGQSDGFSVRFNKIYQDLKKIFEQNK